MGRVLILGASGMLGSALRRKISTTHPLVPSKKELNLLDRSMTEAYFSKNRPSRVYMCAARVGGIAANMRSPYAFFTENIEMQMNFFSVLKKYPVEKAVLVGSSCVYPKLALQPMKENQLFSGPLEPTNEAYAVAKLAGISQAKYLFYESNLVTISPIVANIYGQNDYYDEGRSHVISALIKKFEEARVGKADSVCCWGTGAARREFIHVDDVAEILIELMNSYNSIEPINVGTGYDISLLHLAELIKKLTGYDGEIRWDHSKPEGMLQKCLDIEKLSSLGLKAKKSLEEGLAMAIEDYRERKLLGSI